MNEHQSDGQSTTKRGSSSEPSARDRAGIGDFAFTEIKEPFGQVHIELIKASDLQKYRDVITFITNDDSLLSNMGSLRMARHICSIAKQLATAQREAAGLREALTHEDIKLAWVTQGHPEFGIECTICIGDEYETLTNQSDPITALINTSKAVRAKPSPAPEAGR